MLNLLFRLLLTFNSLVVFLVMFAVKAHMWIPKLGIYTLFLYTLLPILMSVICIKLSHYLGHDSIEKVENIELGAESYMSVYLGYFFVAVGIPDDDIMLLLFVFIMFYLFSFRKYNISIPCSYCWDISFMVLQRLTVLAYLLFLEKNCMVYVD